MEELGISEFPDQKSRMATFCADINYVSAELKARISTHSRMITVRDRYIDLMLQEPEGSLLFEAEQMAFLEGLTMVSLLTKNMTIDKVADCHPKRPPVPYYPASVSHIIRPAINHYSTVLLT